MHWTTVFKNAPNLLHVHLVNTPAEVATPINDEASKVCPRLENFMMPKYIQSRSGTYSPFTKTLCSSLERVFKREGSKGVCVLGVPFVAETDPYAESTAYVEALCKWCPSLRLQNIFCHGMANDGELLCREQWIIDAVTWDRFCAACVKLKTVNWTVVPFSTEFFHIFAKHRKPELRELDIAAPGKWNWAQYITVTKADVSKGYGRTAKDVSAVLTACPILRRLSIHISNQGLGSRANMDQELFGDDFIEALMRYCPVLQMLQITNYNNDAQQDHTIITFTDRSLRALATLQYRTMLEIKSVNITSNGVYDLVSASPEGFLGQREFGIVFGDTAGWTEKAFYDVVKGFVTKLAEQSGPLPWANRRIALQLVNKLTGKQKGVGRSCSKTYYRDLRKLLSCSIFPISSRQPSLMWTMMTCSSALETLPPPLLRHIIANVLPERDEAKGYLKSERERHLEVFREMALVAKFWYKAFGDAVAERIASDLEIHIGEATRQDLLEVRRSVVLRRSVQGRCQMRAVPTGSRGFDAQWAILFSHMPSLQTLDLQSVAADDSSVIAIIDAVSTRCLDLKSLRLPAADRMARAARRYSFRNNEADRQPLADAVLRSLKRWNTMGTR